jgi:hypothetical protein
MPIIGFLSTVSPDGFEDRVRAFGQGLQETGYVEGMNVAIATAGPSRSIACRSWRPIWCAGRSR